jgi:hypothetical protein
MYSGSEDAVMGNSTYQAPAQSGNSTDSVYNQGRQSKISAGQYAQYGQAAMGLGTQLAANQSLTGEDKQYANNKAISGTVDSTLAAATPWYGYAKAGSDMGRSMVQRDETGAPVGKMNKQLDAVMKPQHQMAIDDATKGNYGLAAAEMFMPGIGYESRSNSLGMGEGINKMFNSNNSSTYQYANGGMNMQPNAEVEKQENTLNPDGSTTQFDGPSHEQGGIPTNLEKGTMIFSDKLKHNGKTFAQLNKPNMTHKEDKILDDKKASAISKLTANLMKQAKNKSSEELFEKQESLKQERVEKYIKRMGGVQKYPLGGTSGQTLNNNSIVTPSIGQDPRYYTYQGNPVMKPGLRALSKDSGVTTDIGMDNYNNLLNTRSQVQNSKVNVGKQLPKFEYINDPSKGDYNTQFENYKKVNVGYFRNGGQLPKYDEGDIFGYKPTNKIDQMRMQQALWNSQNKPSSSSWLTPEVMQASSDALIEEGYTNPSSPVINTTPTANTYPIRRDKNGKLIFDTPTSSTSSVGTKRDQELYDEELARMNNSINKNKFDWKGLGTQALSFAANNAGNIYDLARADKTETRKYDRMTPNLLDPTAALRDAEAQTRRAEYNVRGASSGNAGTYLSNRVALNTQNIENKDRIRQQYANANAGILNETSKINTGIANEEILANAKIRANARNIKQSAIASMGSNTANQMNDIRNTNMDQKRLDNLVKMYPSLSKDPEMLKYLMSFK